MRFPCNSKDMRTDPIYEKGSFGSTGSHSGKRQKRIRKGDRMFFIQGYNRVVFITPPTTRVTRNDGHIVFLWNALWKMKKKRPLELRYGMKLDLKHAQMLIPDVRNMKEISFMRNHIPSAINSDRFVRDCKSFVKAQEAKHKDKIYAEHYCQTFCENEDCKSCRWLAEAKRRENECYSPNTRRP